ncbi:MAG: hypothetical protein J6U68_01440, partial [Clostridia bacterium]|nr:hypothetical protein [Clostridia bacterium]
MAKPMKKKNGNAKIIIFYVALFLAIALALTFVLNQQDTEEPPEYGDVVRYFQLDLVKTFSVTSDGVITLEVYEDYEIPEAPKETAAESESATAESESASAESESVAETQTEEATTQVVTFDNEAKAVIKDP